MQGSVTEILIAKNAGDPLTRQNSATAEAGRGIVGDRYYTGKGTFSEKLKGTPDVELTLIETEEINAFNATTRQALKPSDFRRNLVTQGVKLNDLVGAEFTVGEVRLKGIRLCEPCAHLSSILGPEIMKHMVHKSGLRAQVVSGGELNAGDKIIS